MTHEGPTIDDAGDDYTVIDCQHCQFAHVVPLPDHSTLEKLYAETYYEQEKPNYFTHAEEDRGWLELVYAEYLAILERWTAPTARRLLDVGSGPGLFLHTARGRKWECFGIEPSHVAATYSRQKFGLDVHHGVFDDDFVNGRRDLYDAVVLTEVLEHVPDPETFLRRAHTALKVGGMVLVVVPNDYSILQGALVQQGLKKWWLAPPAHLNYFNAKSLSGLFKRCDFATADITCTFPMELFVLMGMNYVGHDDVGRQAHGMRKRLEIALEQTGLGDAKRELYKALARRGIGRDIVLVGKKL